VRTEETSLFPEDEARSLPRDEIAMVVDARMPRIRYCIDGLFRTAQAPQMGELPFLEVGERAILNSARESS